MENWQFWICFSPKGNNFVFFSLFIFSYFSILEEIRRITHSSSTFTLWPSKSRYQQLFSSSAPLLNILLPETQNFATCSVRHLWRRPTYSLLLAYLASLDHFDRRACKLLPTSKFKIIKTNKLKCWDQTSGPKTSKRSDCFSSKSSDALAIFKKSWRYRRLWWALGRLGVQTGSTSLLWVNRSKWTFRLIKSQTTLECK